MFPILMELIWVSFLYPDNTLTGVKENYKYLITLGYIRFTSGIYCYPCSSYYE